MSDVAETIFLQMGGSKFLAMTGAGLLKSDTSLYINLPKKAKNKINKVVIAYDHDRDLYTMTFYEYRRAILDVIEIKKIEGVYAEDLQRIFTRETGLDTHL